MVIKIHEKGQEKITAYTISASNISATILDYGAILTQFLINDQDVVLGYNDPFEYINDDFYLGAIIGRSCGRTASGQFKLNDTDYQLPINNGPNSLHGGLEGLGKKKWNLCSVSSQSIHLSYISKHLDQGYPGTVEFNVAYSLSNDGSLTIDFRAILLGDSVSTYINLTSHPYFNLSTNKSNVLSHTFFMPNITQCLNVDATQVPTGDLIEQSKMPRVFFLEPDTIGSRIPFSLLPLETESTSAESEMQEESLLTTRGFDHYYLFPKKVKKPLVKFECPESRIGLVVSSTAPGFQFYTGYFLDCKGKGTYGAFSGAAFEPSFPPDAINSRERKDAATLKKGKPWTQQIVYQLYTF